MAFMFYGNTLGLEYQGHYSMQSYKYHHTCCHFFISLKIHSPIPILTKYALKFPAVCGKQADLHAILSFFFLINLCYPSKLSLSKYKYTKC